MIKIINVNSYFGLFDALANSLGGAMRGLDQNNLVFCEEKVSLMVERKLFSASGGSFNTKVYSFGKYLRAKKTLDNLLSREGSAMAIKKILGEIPLVCFIRSKNNLAPSLFDMIIQLKSAGVDYSALESACSQVSGILKNKIADISTVYKAYEEYLVKNNLIDQNASLTFLPNVIENDKEIENANVYIVGFSSFTVQIRKALSALLKKAKSVTAILTSGGNRFAYVNETKDIFTELCIEAKIPFEESYVESDFAYEGKTLSCGLFNPTTLKNGRQTTDKIFASAFENKREEVKNVATVIKNTVLSGKLRYRDITLIVPDKEGYRRDVKDVFAELEIPFFFDEKKKPQNHPFITLLLDYADLFRKNFARANLLGFVKNPLVCEDKDFLDRFENYLIKYNVDYGRIKLPFTFNARTQEELSEFEQFRQKICEHFYSFNINKLIDGFSIADKITKLTNELKEIGEIEESAVNEQIFSSVKTLLAEMDKILGNENIPPFEFKKVFLSGVSALELSIIPQYNDAVFVGGFKEAGLCKAEYLFALGLTSSVPEVKDDVALLTDNDISSLQKVKVLVEPKIQIVNHRSREETAMGLCSFNQKLFLSYPLFSAGKKSVKSEVVVTAEKTFTCKPFSTFMNSEKRVGLDDIDSVINREYLTKKQGLKSFATGCSDFALGKLNDFTYPTAFFRAVGGGDAEKIVDFSNKEVVETKQKLENGSKILLNDVTSATAIEDFYKCPYKFFVTHGLGARERETGTVDNLSIGNLMHILFKEYLQNIDKVKDEKTSDALFSQLAEKILKTDEYKRFLDEQEYGYSIKLALEECRRFCYKNYLWQSASYFKTERKNLEVAFGDGAYCVYPAIPLLGGKVKLKGKIDRVDTYGDYCRIIDYKTGKVEDGDKFLFSGTKLQLWLYGKAVNDKTLVGAYYMPVFDKYSKPNEKEGSIVVGKTVNDESLLAVGSENDCGAETAEIVKTEPVTDESEPVTDESPKRDDNLGEKRYVPFKKPISAEQMSALVDYAVILSENAVSEMEKGTIIPTPYDGACEYCQFSSLCGHSKEYRKDSAVSTDFIVNAVNEYKEKN